MTHDELLEKIKEYSAVMGDASRRPFYDAMLAVVELHEPIDSIRGIVCIHCFTDALHRTEFYPCPTIEAIERELA